jgi:hypothetical protein
MQSAPTKLQPVVLDDIEAGFMQAATGIYATSCCKRAGLARYRGFDTYVHDRSASYSALNSSNG